MDFIVEIVHKGLPIFLIMLTLAFGFKAYIVSKMKRFDIAEIFFSFFKFYSNDQINMSSKRKRVVFMRLNNFINYFIYIVIGFLALVFFVTKNAA